MFLEKRDTVRSCASLFVNYIYCVCDVPSADFVARMLQGVYESADPTGRDNKCDETWPTVVSRTVHCSIRC